MKITYNLIAGQTFSIIDGVLHINDIEVTDDELKELRGLVSGSVANNDGWIEWNGGRSPEDYDVIVEVKLRNGKIIKEKAGILDWVHDCDAGDIIAYRVVN